VSVSRFGSARPSGNLEAVHPDPGVEAIAVGNELDRVPGRRTVVGAEVEQVELNALDGPLEAQRVVARKKWRRLDCSVRQEERTKLILK
jgi:hypothetical protein